MGRTFRLYFEDPGYFTCKGCGTHIALQEDYVSDEDMESPVLEEGLFITVVNVEVHGQQRPIVARCVNHTVSDICCVKCGNKLGFKYILTFIAERGVENELVQLNMDKVLLHVNEDLDVVEVEHRG
ncbi:protein yippee-like At3g11230 [Henckelia pumila]|uniref:protein yippee-like At3g11230 n=1 Tax=Henckelia pumila TaxID=405737 RepID=UPI003C6E3147